MVINIIEEQSDYGQSESKLTKENFLEDSKQEILSILNKFKFEEL